MEVRRELLIGCGGRRDKRVYPRPGVSTFENLVTLDVNEAHAPDVLFDLEDLPLPFPENYFDEVHAYEVLEHVGRQGDYRFFFAQFEDFWRILKPDGYFCASVPLPTSPWAFGDPSHTRVIPRESLQFLDQREYERQVGVTSMSDFRFCYHADFRVEYVADVSESLYFALRANKK